MKLVVLVPVFNAGLQVDNYMPRIAGLEEREEVQAIAALASVLERKKFISSPHVNEDFEYILLDNMDIGAQARIRMNDKKLIVRAGPYLLEHIRECDGFMLDIQDPRCEEYLRYIDTLGRPGTMKMAVNVETRAQLNDCLARGFSLFVGTFYMKHAVTQKRLSELKPVVHSKIRLMAEIGSWGNELDNYNISAICDIIQSDVFLSLNVLKLANNATYHGSEKINSIREGIMRIGATQMRSWAMSVLATSVSEDSMGEMSRMTLIKAKFMELMAKILNVNAFEAFYTGILSMAGLILGTEQEMAIREFNVSASMRMYLRYEDDMGRLLQCADDYLHMRVLECEKMLADKRKLYDEMYRLYIEAVLWVGNILKNIEGGDTKEIG